jgi:processive 1,2-diacylglycerol beta-glucosyltransferase
MAKRILFISPEKPGGVEYHRIEIPLIHMMETTEHEYNVTNAVMGLDFKPDLVIANRKISIHSKQHNTDTIKYLKENNIPYIIDVDDYWNLSHDHPLREHYRENEIPGQVIESLKGAAEVWTTHEVLADKVRKYNSNVVIIPNAINFDQPQFARKPKATDKVVIGWAGSSTHVPDINLLKTSMHRLHKDKDLAGKYSILHAGWHHETKESHHFEKIFTAGYRATPDQYKRFPAIDVYNYAKAYDIVHISLCPLVDNEFNRCKSFLKALESGAKGCAVIASNVHPYNDLLRHEDNAMLVDPKNNEKGWHNAVKRLVNDKVLRERLATNLYNDIRKVYDIKLINQLRINRINNIL